MKAATICSTSSCICVQNNSRFGQLGNVKQEKTPISVVFGQKPVFYKNY